MKYTIRDRLVELRQVAEATGQVPEPEYTQLVKAFRAIHFGRCPSCDQQGLVSYIDGPRQTHNTECRNCGRKVAMDCVEIASEIEKRGAFTMSTAYQLAVVDKFCS